MKRRQTISITAAMLIVSALSGCGMLGSSNSNGNAKAGNVNAAKPPSAPAVEITAEALGKEWLADRTAADTKYKGKVIAFTGDIWVAQQIGEQIFVSFMAVPFDLKTGGAKIECVSELTKDARMLVEGFKLNQTAANNSSDKNAKPPQMKAKVRGTYDSSAPAERADGFITLKPCELSLY